MAAFTIKDLTFTYPLAEKAALKEVNLSIQYGEFIAVCGKSGCGKSTLLRNLKTVLAPHGQKTGQVLFYDRPLDTVDQREQSSRIGYVLQNPDNQIVTDKVWHELSFGLESLGYDTKTIRLRVAEMASFFGIQEWFMRDVSKLSGGQKQLLNLASVMVMQPDVLILDEPTSQLDPIAAGDFLETVKKINREIGTTVIITEHRLEDVLPMADRAIVMDAGLIIVDDTPANAGARLAQMDHDMFVAMPSPLQVYAQLYKEGIGKDLDCPLDVRDGRAWLTRLMAGKQLIQTEMPSEEESDHKGETPVIQLKDVWFKYDKNDKDVVKDLSMSVYPGELFCIVGGNGTGKTTTLTLISGINKAYRGRISIKGKEIQKYASKELFAGLLGVLPQNPQAVFVENTVRLDLMEILEGKRDETGKKLTSDEKQRRLIEIAHLVEIEDLLEMHPYDLSGGEQQRAALGKVLLLNPEILLLDEPTKGIDNHFKGKLAQILRRLLDRGVTIIMVSHDVEFCGRYGDRCAMFFDGNIVTTNAPNKFFSGNSFYTTAANRMSRHIFENAITADDVATLCKINLQGDYVDGNPGGGGGSRDSDGLGGSDASGGDEGSSGGGDNPSSDGQGGSSEPDGDEEFESNDASSDGSKSVRCDFQVDDGERDGIDLTCKKSEVCSENLTSQNNGAETAFSKAIDTPNNLEEMERSRKTKATVATIGMLLLIPITLFAGIFFLDDRKYYFISLMVVIYTLIPFFALFERRKPQAREMIVIAVLIAICVVGRAAFFMIPSFKPVTAIVIISGICLGPQAGFLVGAMSAFVSNFLFGQGPWTPWQMFGFGIIGLIAGFLAQRNLLSTKRVWLMIFGALMSFFVFGGIVDLWTIFGFYPEPDIKVALIVYTMAIPFNLIHAAATAIFLYFLSKPMIEKLERIKLKYGLLT